MPHRLHGAARVRRQEKKTFAAVHRKSANPKNTFFMSADSLPIPKTCFSCRQTVCQPQKHVFHFGRHDCQHKKLVFRLDRHDCQPQKHIFHVGRHDCQHQKYVFHFGRGGGQPHSCYLRERRLPLAAERPRYINIFLHIPRREFLRSSCLYRQRTLL